MMTGNDIASKDATMVEIGLEELVGRIGHPDESLANLVRRARISKTYGSDAYAAAKKRLPYFVCGKFEPAIRRKENFAYTEYFVVDIDHLSSKGLEAGALKGRLSLDERVVACFISPGEDGLKVLFHLEKRCYDMVLYSAFYKEFCSRFSMEYGLSQVIDNVTSDVTRACFLSFDENVFFNPSARAVSLETYVNTVNDDDFFGLLSAQESGSNKDTTETSEESGTKLPDDTLKQIRETLNPRLEKMRANKSASIFVPSEVDSILDGLKTFCDDNGVHLSDALPIQYGRQLRFMAAGKKAEVNLFCGRRGFSVVESTKSGMDKELNSICRDLINVFISEK